MNDRGGTVEKVRENLYRIRVGLPGNPLKELNSYLIVGEERNLLIDTGFRQEACKRDLLVGLEALKCDLSRTDILLTHLHGDHAGLAPELIAPGRKIYLSAEEKAYLEDPAAGEEFWRWAAESYRRAGMPEEILARMETENPAIAYAPAPGCRQYEAVSEGEVLEVGGYRLKVLLTPGHTPGHICLWDEEKQILFTGDHVLFDITPNIIPWPQLPDALGSYLRSLKAIRDLPVKLALPGHRESGDFQSRVDALVRHHEERLEEIAAICRETPGLTPYEIAGRMRWSIRARSWEDFPAGQKYFALGECLAHLKKGGATGSRATETHGGKKQVSEADGIFAECGTVARCGGSGA